jgi:hypothetical protein
MIRIRNIFKKTVLTLAAVVAVVLTCMVLLNYLAAPLIESRVRQIATERIGGLAESLQVRIMLPEAVVSVKGFKASGGLAGCSYSLSMDEALLRIGLVSTFAQKRPVLNEFRARNIVLTLKKNPAAAVFHPAPAVEQPSRAAADAGAVGTKAGGQFSELYIKKLSAENAHFIFNDYSAIRPPAIIEIAGITAGADNFLISFRETAGIKGAVNFKGYFNSAPKGVIELFGTVSKSGSAIDFELESEARNVDLTYFSQYYANTSFSTLKEARVDISSNSTCRNNELMTRHSAHIYGVKLDSAASNPQDRLFGLPAVTVARFFNDYGGEVEFDFDINGTLNDPRFEPGPVIKEVMANAIGDRISAALNELPREVVKISEKAVKGKIDVGKEAANWLEEIKKRFSETEAEKSR